MGISAEGLGTEVQGGGAFAGRGTRCAVPEKGEGWTAVLGDAAAG